jgi:hypothetical protein
MFEYIGKINNLIIFKTHSNATTQVLEWIRKKYISPVFYNYNMYNGSFTVHFLTNEVRYYTNYMYYLHVEPEEHTMRVKVAFYENEFVPWMYRMKCSEQLLQYEGKPYELNNVIVKLPLWKSEYEYYKLEKHEEELDNAYLELCMKEITYEEVPILEEEQYEEFSDEDEPLEIEDYEY